MVFHCATAAPAAANTANKKLMHDVNVKGTQNVIDACASQGVARLVYTSSASVVFDGTDLINMNEDAPYAAKPIDYYTETKVPWSPQDELCPYKGACITEHQGCLTRPRSPVPYLATKHPRGCMGAAIRKESCRM